MPKSRNSAAEDAGNMLPELWPTRAGHAGPNLAEEKAKSTVGWPKEKVLPAIRWQHEEMPCQDLRRSGDSLIEPRSDLSENLILRL